MYIYNPPPPRLESHQLSGLGASPLWVLISQLTLLVEGKRGRRTEREGEREGERASGP